MFDKISLAGDLGSGKSTVSAILIERLGAEYYSTGSIVRSIAAKMGMSVVELNKYMETHPEIDNEIDDGLVALSEIDKLLIIDSRMAWHFTKDTFKVYLSCGVETGALRIMNAHREGEHALTFEDTVADTRRRRQSEQKRYMQQYGVDIKNLSNYSLVVDTAYASPEEVAEVIINSFRHWQSERTARFCYLSPERIYYPDDAPNGELLSSLIADMEEGRPLPEVKVVEREGEFYLFEGLESALAHSFNMSTYIPATLTEGDLGDKQFVRMKNSI